MSNLRTKLGLPSSNIDEKIVFIPSVGYGFTAETASNKVSQAESAMTNDRLASLLDGAEDDLLSSALKHNDNNFSIINLFEHSYIIEADETLYIYTEDKQKANIVHQDSNIVYVNVESVDVIVYTTQGSVVELTKEGVHSFYGISSKNFPIPDDFLIQLDKSESFLDHCVDSGLFIRQPSSVDDMHELIERFINWREELSRFEKMILVHHASVLCDLLDKAVQALEPNLNSEDFVSAKDVQEGLLLRDRLECLLMFDLSEEKDLVDRIHKIDHRYKVLLHVWVPPEDDVEIQIDERLWMAESADLNTYWGGSNLK